MPPGPPRVAAALGALVALVTGTMTLSLAAFSILVSAQRPDPRVPDGDPCCGHPDTWGQVAEGMAVGVVFGAVGLGLLALMAVLLTVALSGRAPGWARRRRAR